MTPTAGILGAGTVGKAVARFFLAAGRNVVISNSRGPDSLGEVIAELGAGAEAGTSAQAAQAPLVVLATPWTAVESTLAALPPWSGNTLVDATNAIDFPAFSPRDLKGRLSTQIVADAVPSARVVKAFNTLAATILGADPVAHGGRRVLFVSSDDPSARLAIVDLVDRLGFAAVDLGGIAEGGRVQQFGGGVSGKEFVQLG